jgi:hypothetical protein
MLMGTDVGGMGVGVSTPEAFAAGVWGVLGVWGSTLGFAICDAASAREWLLSRRRFGASLIFG